MAPITPLCPHTYVQPGGSINYPCVLQIGHGEHHRSPQGYTWSTEPSELDKFKAKVWNKAMKLAEEHDMCEVVEEALEELGIYPQDKYPNGTILSYQSHLYHKVLNVWYRYGPAGVHKYDSYNRLIDSVLPEDRRDGLKIVRWGELSPEATASTARKIEV